MNEILVNIGGYELNLTGLIVGLASFLIIIVSRWSCIVGEYYFTKKLWIGFLIIGVLSVAISPLLENIVISAILGIFGFSYLWGIMEIIEQENRVDKGWYPKNPKRKK
ncbi:MAG: DUF4491 family protein [Bacteroidota bacterium]|nr:DUF4491 family protein [Bacteroidota bacterium]